MIKQRIHPEIVIQKEKYEQMLGLLKYKLTRYHVHIMLHSLPTCPDIFMTLSLPTWDVRLNLSALESEKFK